MKQLAMVVALLAALGAGTAHADPRAEVVDAFEKAMDDGSYRMLMDASQGGRTVRSEMSVQLPNRFHMKNEGGEFIVLPAGTWMNAGGQWMKMPMNMSQMIEGFGAEAIEKAMASIQEVEYVGEAEAEDCGSKHYRYRAAGEFMGVKSDTETEVWICQDNGLPVRMVSNERGKADKVTIVYDWKTPVDIQAPN